VSGVSVQIDEQGPAEVRVIEQLAGGERVAHEPGERYVAEACERAWRDLARAGRRLPAGTVEVLVLEDEFRHVPSGAEVGRAIARAA